MPRIFKYIFILSLCLAPLSAFAATADDDAYLAAADAAQANPDAADWQKLRQLYIPTSFYQEQDGQGAVPGLEAAADKALADNGSAAIAAVREILRRHMAKIDSHFYALHLVAEKHAGFIDGGFERKAAKGLLAAALAGGDGQSTATAYHTIGPDEEVAIIRAYYNFDIRSRAVEAAGGRSYTVYDVADAKSGKTAKMYFIAAGAGTKPDAEVKAGGAAMPQPLEEAEVNQFRGLAAQHLPQPKDDDYLALVDKALADPAAAPWHEIRDRYIQTSFFRQQGGLMPVQVFSDALDKAAAGNDAEAAPRLKTFLRQHFGNIASHYEALKALKKNPRLKNILDPATEEAAAGGLLRDITASGDGKAQATAFRTITLNEQQYVTTEVLKKPVEGMELQMHGGHIYNIVHLRDPKTGDLQNVFFLNDDRMTQLSLAPKGAGISVLPPDSPQEEAPPADAEYLDLVDRAMDDPKRADWERIRSLYPDTSFYKRIGGTSLSHDSADVIRQATLIHSDKGNQALKAYLRENFGSVGTHIRAANYAADTKAQNIDPNFEMMAFAELIKTIARTGDGTSLATPFVLISPEEESFFLETFFNAHEAKPQFRRENGVVYSVATVTQPKTGKKVDVYFVFDSRMIQHP